MLYWASALGNGTLNKESVIDAIIKAAITNGGNDAAAAKISNAKYVNDIYNNILGRSFGQDLEGMAFWTNVLDSGMLDRSMLMNTINQVAASNNDTLFFNANLAFVNDLHQRLFNRQIDGENLAFWTNSLNAGMDRAWVILNFLNNASGVDAQTLANKSLALNEFSAKFYDYSSSLSSAMLDLIRPQVSAQIQKIDANTQNPVSNMDNFLTQSDYIKYSNITPEPTPTPTPTPPTPTPTPPTPPTPPKPKPVVLDFVSGAELNFTTGKYGDKQIDTSKVIAINGINAELKIVGTATKDLHLFMSGGKISSNDSKDKTTIYLGGSEDENGEITAGLENIDAGFGFLSSLSSASKVFANTTGEISVTNQLSLITTPIDLSLVDAKISQTSGAITKDGGNAGKAILNLADYFSNIDKNDTLTYTAGYGITKIEGTDGNDIISMADNATRLATIATKYTDGEDIIKVNATAWKWAGSSSNVSAHVIELKAGDKVANLDFTELKNAQGSATDDSDRTNTIDTLITDDERVAYFMKINFQDGSDAEYYLVYNEDGSPGLNGSDVVMQILGATSATADGNVITFN